MVPDQTAYREAQQENKNAYLKRFQELVEDHPGEVIAVLEDGGTVECVDPDEESLDDFWTYLRTEYGDDELRRAYSTRLPDRPDTEHSPVRID